MAVVASVVVAASAAATMTMTTSRATSSRAHAASRRCRQKNRAQFCSSRVRGKAPRLMTAAGFGRCLPKSHRSASTLHFGNPTIIQLQAPARLCFNTERTQNDDQQRAIPPPLYPH